MHFSQGGSTYYCTGSLLSDRDPNSYVDYFLTANHCIHDAGVADTLECFWFYQTITCNGPVPDLYGVPQTLGADLLATGSASGGSDFTLLRLRQPSPGGVYYLGWSTSGLPSYAGMTCIHHPRGDYKRISFGSYNASDSTSGPCNGTVESRREAAAARRC